MIATLPALGAPWPGAAGLFSGIALDVGGEPYAFNLRGDVAEPRKTWVQQMSWARGLEASLPTTFEMQVLLHLFPGRFTDWAYWTCDEREGVPGDAWVCLAEFGVHSTSCKTDRASAVAVCRVPLVDLTFRLAEAAS